MSEPKRLDIGYVQVYTGTSKGKTTAALGLAFRAMGHGMKTYIGQFMKGLHYGELDAAEMTGGLITIEQYGIDAFIHVEFPPDPAHVDLARKGFQKVTDALLSGRYDIVVLDEINTAIYFGLIETGQVLELISKRPKTVEMILTGRYAPREIIDRADLVTEMTQIKHYFDAGVMARDGIER